jgi:hypothetical protein
VCPSLSASRTWMTSPSKRRRRSLTLRELSKDGLPHWTTSRSGSVRKKGKRPNDDEFWLLIEQQVTWRWDGQEANIGTMYTAGWHPTSELAHRAGHEDHDDYKIVPIKGTTWFASFDRTALEATAPGRLDIEPQR